MATAKLRGPADLRAGERMGGLDKLGQQVRARRSEIGLSQTELAELGGFSQSTVRTAERGEAGVTLTPKTLVGLYSALGWAPRFPQDLADGFEPVEVLSAESIREIAGVLLSLLHKPSARARASAERLLSEFHELVDGLADEPPRVPESSAHLAHTFAREMPIGALNQLAREITARTGQKFQAALGQGLGALIPTAYTEKFSVDVVPSEAAFQAPGGARTQMSIMAQTDPSGRRGLSLLEAKVILESGLGDEVQEVLAEYVIQQHTAADASILAGLHTLIRAYAQVRRYAQAEAENAD